MKTRTFIYTCGIFLISQVFINIAWGQMLRTQSVDLGEMLGMLVFSLPFGVIGAVILFSTKQMATPMGLISLAFGILDEILALAGGNGSIGMSGLTHLQFTKPILFSLLSIITYWFAGWSIPTYFINAYMPKLDREIHSTLKIQPWVQQWWIWIGIFAVLALGFLSYLENFS